MPLILFANCYLFPITQCFYRNKHVEWTTAKLGIAAELMLLKATDNPTGVALIAIRVHNDMVAKLHKYHRREHGRSG